jgi:hypothetical protein
LVCGIIGFLVLGQDLANPGSLAWVVGVWALFTLGSVGLGIVTLFQGVSMFLTLSSSSNAVKCPECTTVHTLAKGTEFYTCTKCGQALYLKGYDSGDLLNLDCPNCHNTFAAGKRVGKLTCADCGASLVIEESGATISGTARNCVCSNALPATAFVCQRCETIDVTQLQRFSAFASLDNVAARSPQGLIHFARAVACVNSELPEILAKVMPAFSDTAIALYALEMALLESSLYPKVTSAFEDLQKSYALLLKKLYASLVSLDPPRPGSLSDRKGFYLNEANINNIIPLSPLVQSAGADYDFITAHDTFLASLRKINNAALVNEYPEWKRGIISTSVFTPGQSSEHRAFDGGTMCVIFKAEGLLEEAERLSPQNVG